MNGEQKKWNVWLPEKRICQVEANHYHLNADGRAIFFSAHEHDEEFINNPHKFLVAEFLQVTGIIEDGNNDPKRQINHRDD